MGLETATYIDGLVITNPTSTDPKSAGDDHFRLLKSTIKASFPNIAGAVTPTHTVLNYMLGVTSAVQTQIDSKGAITGQTWTGTHNFAATTSIGNVSATEISYLDGVTSAIQTQIDSKGAIAGQTWTGTHVFPSTVSFGNVSATELSYLDGVTSAIQTQMDLKAPLASPALTGVPTAPTAAVGTNTPQIATMAALVQAGLSSALPGQSLGFLWSSGPGTAAFSQTHTGYAQKESKGANIACAPTIDLSAATGNLVHITGSTGPVTDITIASGAEYSIVWDSTPTITHNASKIILPTGANITVAAGDQWDIRGDGANVARVKIHRADGRPSRLNALELIATLTPTVAATLDLLSIFSSTYDEYEIIGDGITIGGSSGQSIALRMANAGTADSASNYWVNAGNSTSAAIASVLGGGSVGCSFKVIVTNVNDASGRNKMISYSSVGETSGGPNYAVASGGFAYVKAATVSGFRLITTGGDNFAATGEIRVYGVKRT
jgi:hypothetical protein